MLNSDKGMLVFNNITDRIASFPQNISAVYAGNLCFTDSVTINPQSTEFLEDLEQHPFDKMIKKYTKIPLHISIISKMKSIMKKF